MMWQFYFKLSLCTVSQKLLIHSLQLFKFRVKIFSCQPKNMWRIHCFSEFVQGLHKENILTNTLYNFPHILVSITAFNVTPNQNSSFSFALSLSPVLSHPARWGSHHHHASHSPRLPVSAGKPSWFCFFL